MFLSRLPHHVATWTAKLAIASLLAPIISPLIGSVSLEVRYTYANEYREIQALDSVRSQTVSFDGPKNSFVIELETESSIQNEEDVKFTLSTTSINPLSSNPADKKVVSLEIEGDEVFTGKFFTSPVHFDPTDRVEIRCNWCENLIAPKYRIVALDSRSSVQHLAYSPEKWLRSGDIAHAAIEAFPVISRSEWGADEGLRYADSPIWKSILEKNANVKPSEAAKKQEAKNAAIEAHLREKYPDDFVTNEIIRTEDGHPLVWPIEKTKYIRRIVLHHTAENNVRSLSDAELMRSMYYYHTIVRGWGDIGYQYVVGQRGQIYEWRAGGDYTVWAHASWNNRWSVGVSVIGNFESDALVKEQQASLDKLLTALTRKYGISTSTITYGHKACKVDEECATLDFEIPSIVGHRDVWYTSCPGANLYKELLVTYAPNLAERSKNEKLIANAVYKPETLRRVTSTSSDVKTAWSVSSKPNYGPNIRVKLSIPSDLGMLELEAIEWNPILAFKSTSGKIKYSKISLKRKGKSIELTMGNKKYVLPSVSLSAEVVRVNNWVRIPAWDKEKKYNDNEFRGKLEARIEDGKLILINELPIELYLRGLAEFSNGENSEKAKTILVAARSYALYYTDPKNRKFPGKPYDGSDDPDVFQKYLGYGYEKRSPSTTKYAEETSGEILTYKKNSIKPWYFNQSSGRTLSALEYCQNRKKQGSLPATAICEDIPYLQSVADPGSEWKTQLWHGVGISGLGASYFASSLWWTHEEILRYYLTGVEIEKKY